MKRPSIYVKMKVLGAIEVVEGKTRHERIHNVAQMTFLDEQGEPHRFTWRTIQTWYYRYKNHGVTAMNNNPRADKGHPRKVTPEEVLEAIKAALPHFHGKKHNKSAIYRFCIEKGLLRADQIARTTFCRFVRQYEMLKEDVSDNRRRLAFSMQYANQLWQADTMFGPQVSGSNGQRRQAKLIALIDDASRVLCHGEFFFDENADAMIQALRAAFYKRGVPEQLLVDNGSIYCCQEITLVCARVGCILRHTAVRDAAAKGKIERFFRRVRDQFLVRSLDLSSLGQLNKQFTHWVEHEYNAVEHSTLGMKPIDRFGVDLSRIRFLSPSEDTDELFYAEATRTVKKDNTFSFQGDRYAGARRPARQEDPTALRTPSQGRSRGLRQGATHRPGQTPGRRRQRTQASQRSTVVIRHLFFVFSLHPSFTRYPSHDPFLFRSDRQSLRAARHPAASSPTGNL